MKKGFGESECAATARVCKEVYSGHGAPIEIEGREVLKASLLQEWGGRRGEVAGRSEHASLHKVS